MPSDRLFTRFSTTSAPPRIDQIPEGGFCLSSFLIISKTGRPNELLLGKLDPNGPWERIGGLDKDRAERNSKGWMLPSSHILFGESPQDAARRILDEQLGLPDQKLQGPMVFSEVYGPKNHWDLEFVFLGERDQIAQHPAWAELAFVEVNETPRDQIARYHEDILAHVARWGPARG